MMKNKGLKHFIHKNKERALKILWMMKNKGIKYSVHEIRKRVIARSIWRSPEAARKERKKLFERFKKEGYPRLPDNKMKIVLIRPPFMALHTGTPIGLAYIQAVLKKEGHKVLVWDMNLELERVREENINRDFVIPDTHPAVNKAYERIEEYCDDILKLKPDMVGFSIGHSTVKYGLEMAKRLSKHVRCIAGGPQASFNEQSLMDLGYFDALVSGYGEEAVLEALNSNGIFSKKLIPSKEYLPDYTGITIEKYNGFFPIVTTRGCPNRCSFCTHNYPYFSHSIESVIYQIENTPNIRLVHFNDSNINVNQKRTEELFVELSKLKNKPKITVFGLQIRKGFKKYISKMPEAGVKEAFVGLESGSLRERKSMNKPHWSNDLALEFIKELTSNKILTWCQFIFCYPDQTEKDRQETLDLMKRINNECDSAFVQFQWFKFVVHLGLEEFFKERYGVTSFSPQNWENVLYNPEKVKQLEEKYSKLIPGNAEIYM